MFWNKKRNSADPHYVRDYEKHVAKLIAKHPIDEAMSLAVGGSYQKIGLIEKRLLDYAGLRPGMSLVDIGCGSGRLAATLSDEIEYLGTDVVQSLLDYARSKSPASFKFRRHVAMSVPCRDASVDFICAFSVFTHLQHAETFIYLADATRALRTGGTLMFSFLEFFEPAHWSIFTGTVAETRARTPTHLNMFIERNAIETWAAKLGLHVKEFIDAGAAPQGGDPLGQSVAILRKD